MTEIEDYIYAYEGSQREIMLYFHHMLTHELGLTAKLRFNMPVYYRKSWICSLSPLKNGNIEFGFLRGNELSNSQGLLEDKGRKQVTSIEIPTLQDIPLKEMTEVIHEAIMLDDSVPYASKRKTKSNK